MSDVWEAARKGRVACIQRFLANGVDVNAREPNRGKTALMCASESGHVRAVQELLKAGSDADLRDDYEFAPLHFAVTYGHDKVVKLLLQSGADINMKRKGLTSLMVAIMYRHFHVVKALLDAPGIEVDSTTHTGSTALMQAVSNAKCEKLARLLVHAGANIEHKDVGGNTSLFLACVAGPENLVKALVELGADVNNSVDNGMSPLVAAGSRGDHHAVYELLKAGADVNYSYGVDEYTALSMAVQSAGTAATDDRHVKVVRHLLAWGANPDVQPGGGSVLLLAATASTTGIVKELLVGGAVVGAHLLRACVANFPEGTMQALIDNATDVNVETGDGYTPLMVASGLGKVEVVRMLLRRKADVFAKGSDGLTAIDLAIEAGFAEVVALLRAEEARRAWERRSWLVCLYNRETTRRQQEAAAVTEQPTASAEESVAERVTERRRR